MRRLLFLLLLVSFALKTEAQKIRFTDTSNRWTEYFGWYSGGSNLVWHISSNSLGSKVVISGMDYYTASFGEVRDDTIANKVFVYDPSGDIVLYDYNLKVGDTVKPTSTSGYRHKVSMLDSVIIRGVSHKIWKFDPVSGPDAMPYIVTEGIGCLNEPDFPMHPGYIDQSYTLICFSNRGNRVTVHSPWASYDYLSPATCATTVKPMSSKSNLISIIPNPANETSVIRFPYNMHSGTLAVVSALGQTVQQKEIEDKTELPISDLPLPGIYFYRVTDNETNQTFTGKFIYQ